jgi:hypothetical protein
MFRHHGMYVTSPMCMLSGESPLPVPCPALACQLPNLPAHVPLACIMCMMCGCLDMKLWYIVSSSMRAVRPPQRCSYVANASPSAGSGMMRAFPWSTYNATCANRHQPTRAWLITHAPYIAKAAPMDMARLCMCSSCACQSWRS